MCRILQDFLSVMGLVRATVLGHSLSWLVALPLPGAGTRCFPGIEWSFAEIQICCEVCLYISLLMRNISGLLWNLEC